MEKIKTWLESRHNREQIVDAFPFVLIIALMGIASVLLLGWQFLFVLVSMLAIGLGGVFSIYWLHKQLMLWVDKAPRS